MLLLGKRTPKTNLYAIEQHIKELKHFLKGLQLFSESLTISHITPT